MPGFSTADLSPAAFTLLAGVVGLISIGITLLVAGGTIYLRRRRAAAAPKSVKEALSRNGNVKGLAADGLKSNIPDLQPIEPDLMEKMRIANQQLAFRLLTAESTVHDQAMQLDVYRNEAMTDALTCLPNRRALDEELRRRLAEHSRYESLCCAVLIDIDYFKKFNDEHGHLAGDAVLRQVAKVLRETFRDADVVARYGGEEFAAIMPGVTPREAIQAVERVRQAVKMSEFEFEGKRLRVTVSCGVASAANDDAEALWARADAALYASKAAGRNASHLHDGSILVGANGEQVRRLPKSTLAAPLGDPEEFKEVFTQIRAQLAELVSEK